MGDWLYGDESSVAFAAPETTYGEPPTLTSSHTRLIAASTITPEQTRITRPDKRGFRSPREEIIGRESGAFGITTLLLPGAVGVAPNQGVYLKSHFGVETIVASTSVKYTYALRPSITDLSFSHYEKLDADGEAARFITGAYAKTLNISADDLDAPVMLEFGGRGAYQGFTYKDQVDGAVSAASDVTLDDASAVDLRSLVKFGANAAALDTATQQLVTGIGTGEDIELGNNVTLADNDLMYPFFPDTTEPTAEPVMAKDMYASVDGGTTEFEITGFNIAADSMNEYHDDSSGPRMSDVRGAGRYNVVLNMNVTVERDTLKLLNDLNRNLGHDVTLRVGEDAAARRMTIDLNNVKFPPTEPSIPEEGETTLTLSGRAFSDTANDDLFEVTLD